MAIYPRFAYRYTLPYLSNQFDWATRRRMLQGHYAYLNRHLAAAFFEGVLKESLQGWQHTVDGRALRMFFKGPCLVTKHREGDITLAFAMDDVVLTELSFSIIPTKVVPVAEVAGATQAEHLIYVGRVQGTSGHFDAIRMASQLCQDVAPADVLMAALHGFARAIGVDLLVGVDQQGNVSHELMSSAGSSFDYAAFWARYQGHVTAGGHALIHLPYAEKPIGLIASKHRKRTLMKRAFKAGVARQVSAVIQPLVR